MRLEAVNITRAGHAVIDSDYSILKRRNTEKGIVAPPERLTMNDRESPIRIPRRRHILDLLRGQKFAETLSICPASVWHHAENEADLPLSSRN